MIDAKDAKTKTQTMIQSRMSNAIALVEKEVEYAISKGYFATTVAGEALIDEDIRKDVVRHLKVLGYETSYTSGKTLSDSQIKIIWG